MYFRAFRRSMRILFSILVFHACVTAGEELHAGENKRVQAKDTVYDCYLPKAYFDQPERRFPVLFLSHASGNPRFLGFQAWAERRNVIVIAITDSKNGPWEAIDRAQDGVWSDAETRLRLHPCLRYAWGNSGGVGASVRLIAKHPDQFAGLLANVHSAGSNLPKHMAAVYVGGLKDETHPISAVRGTADALKSRGLQVWFIEDPGDHDTAVYDGARAEPLLDWLLLSTCISHPKLDKAGLADGSARIEAELAETATLKPEAGMLACELLLRIPSIAQNKKLGVALRTNWANAAIAAAEGADPLIAHERLTAIAEHEQFPTIEAKLRQDITDRLKDLRKDEPVKSAWAAMKALRAAEAAESKARSARGALADVLQMYLAIVKKWPDTPAAKTARDSAERVQAKMGK